MKHLFITFSLLLSFQLTAQIGPTLTDILKPNFKSHPFNAQNSSYNEQLNSYLDSISYIEEAGKIVLNQQKGKVTSRKSHLSDFNDFYWETDEYSDLEATIPPFLDSVANGQYVRYYAPIPFLDGDTIKFHRNKIACIFSIKDNELDGPAYWYTIDEQLCCKKGTFVHGKKEGEWLTFTSQNYLDYLESNYYISEKESLNIASKKRYNSNLQLVTTAHFSNDLKEGPAEYSCNGTPLIEGNFHNGQPSGSWKRYCWKPFNPIKGINFNQENRVLIEAYTYNKDKSLNENNNKFYREEKHGSDYNLQITYLEDYWIESKNITSVQMKQTNSNYYLIADYKRFYPNGQVFFQIETKNGTLTKQTDTAFYANGNIMSCIIEDPNHLDFQSFLYDKKGEILLHEVIDSTGKTIKTLLKNDPNELILDGLKYYKKENSTFNFENHSQSFSAQDVQPHLIRNTYNSDKKEFYNPSYFTPATLTIQNTTKYNDKAFKNTTLHFDTLTKSILCNTKLTVGKVSTSQHWTSCINSTFESKLSKDTILTPTHIRDLEEATTYDFTANNFQLYYNKRLYTGTLEIFPNSKKSKISTSKNTLKISVTNTFSDWDFLLSLIAPLADLLLEKGPFQNIHTIQASIINGKFHGFTIIKNLKNELYYEIKFKENEHLDTLFKYRTTTNLLQEIPSVDTSKYIFKQFIDPKSNCLISIDNKPRNWSTLRQTEIFDQEEKVALWQRTQEHDLIFEYEYTNEGIYTKTKVFDTNNVLLSKKLYDQKNKIEYLNYYYNTGEIYQRAKSINNYLEDTVFSYYKNGQLKSWMIYKNHIFRKEFKFENGQIAEIIENFDLDSSPREQYIGEPNNEAKFDLVFDVLIQYGEGYFPAHYNAFFTQLDSNRNITEQGHYFEGKKIGYWIYDQPKNGCYTINYYKKEYKPHDTLIFSSQGRITEYDEQGNIKICKEILEKKSIYNCLQKETEDIQIFHVISSQDPTFINGKVKFCYTNGSKQSEGQNVNGLPNGLWKFYTTSGDLREIGHFKNGKKVGKWLLGDLSKVANLEDKCFDMDNPEIEKYIEQLKKELKIQHVFYENGIIISSEDFEVQN